MKRPTILFISYALRGHANPCLAIAQQLAARGHLVKYAIPEEGAAWISDAHVSLLTWEPTGRGAGRLTHLQRQVRAEASRQADLYRGQTLVTRSMADTYAPIHRALLDLVKQTKPDLIVTPQTTVPAMDIAVQEGIPLAITAFFPPTSVRRTPGRLGPARKTAPSLSRRLKSFVSSVPLHRAWWRHDVVRRSCSQCVPFDQLLRQHCMISATHQCIEGQESFYPNVHLAGPLVFGQRQLSPDLSQWLDESSRPVIFVAFGTLVTLRQPQIRALLEGFAHAGHRVLWALPQTQRPCLSNVPSSVRLESFVDQQAVLQHPAVAAMVTHGGGNSFMESMLFGKPVLAAALMLDQPFFAHRAFELGVGIPMDGHNLTARKIQDNLLRLLNEESFRRNARRMSSILGARPPAEHAVAILEDLLEGRSTRRAA